MGQLIGALVVGLGGFLAGQLVREFVWFKVLEFAESNVDVLREMRDAVYSFIVEWAAESAGVDLDPSEPLSDKSLCGALGKKTGITIRTLRDKQSILDDIEYWSLAQVEARSGLRFRNIRDKAKTRQDVLKWATPKASELTGIPLSDLSSKEQTTEDVTEHVKDMALLQLAGNIESARQEVGALGIDLEAIIKEIQRKGGVDPQTGLPLVNVGLDMLILGIVARALVLADKRRNSRLATCGKDWQKKDAQRRATARFREANGHRMWYEKVS